MRKAARDAKDQETSLLRQLFILLSRSLSSGPRLVR
jgi:hypothetical protein